MLDSLVQSFSWRQPLLRLVQCSGGAAVRWCGAGVSVAPRTRFRRDVLEKIDFFVQQFFSLSIEYTKFHFKSCLQEFGGSFSNVIISQNAFYKALGHNECLIREMYSNLLYFRKHIA
jgi:hypothetical protein